MKSNQIIISNALKDAKEMKRIMFYLCESDYKVQPAQGIMLSNKLLLLSAQIVKKLECVVKDEADNEA